MATSKSAASSTASSDITSHRVRELSESSEASSVSYSTAKQTATPNDAVSVATTSNTGFTQGSYYMQSVASSGTIPVLPPPTSQAQQGLLRVDVSSAQQKQQNFVPSEISPSSGSSLSTSGQSTSVYEDTRASSQANINYQRTSNNASIAYAPSQAYNSYQETAQYGQPSSSSYFNDFSYGASGGMDSMINIDYGAIDAYNYGMQAPDVIPTVPKGQNGSKIDVSRAIFNQVDTNHDGSISRDEFAQWAQAGQQIHYGQATAPSYQSGHQNFAQSSFVSNSNSNMDIASVLQQSGLGQTMGTWR